MGRHFGDLAVIRGIIYYKLSPHEQKPFATAFSRGIPNFLPRTLDTLYTWLPPFAFGYAVYAIVESAYKTSKKKDARIYETEVPNPPKCPPK
ncbi:hypothetical protein PYW07_015940 [Mythimna separata]|uniref:Cytochrome b-c1 complex subunit 8 n=1 Tax=Mythimna separata TaxID=271217 RepID=A0AAD7YRD1_MYTSE|nr:hypothetical protein PYW07_015940 [Mythimna separata]